MATKIKNEQRRILAVDDDLDSLRMIKKALEWGNYQVETARSGREALEKISDWRPHLVLLDVNMPGLNGLETLTLLRQSLDYSSTIFISGNSNSEDVIRGLDAGADDYICKPFHPLELLARVRCQLRIKDIRDELDRANSRLVELVNIDDLTGLFNMRSLYEKLDHELRRAGRYNRAVSVVMMDMDQFKSVNDENDHLFGSYVLSEVGKIIRSTMRDADFAARYGGDEFLIVLTETHFAGAQSFCERLRHAISQRAFKSGSHEIFLTASLGFSITSLGNKTIDARTLVRYADKALYDAKKRGRDRVESYDCSNDPAGQPEATLNEEAPVRREQG